MNIQVDEAKKSTELLLAQTAFQKWAYMGLNKCLTTYQHQIDQRVMRYYSSLWLSKITLNDTEIKMLVNF